MINKSNIRKGILIVFVPFGTLIQSVATNNDQPMPVSKSAWRMKRWKLRVDEDKYDPQMEKKCLKTLKDIVWSAHPQATSVFLLEKN